MTDTVNKEIELVGIPNDVYELLEKKASKRHTQPYQKYFDKLEPLLPLIREKIKADDKGYFNLRVSNLQEKFGEGFVDMKPMSFTWGVRYALFFSGLYDPDPKNVGLYAENKNLGTTEHPDYTLRIRVRKPEDKLSVKQMAKSKLNTSFGAKISKTEA